MNAGTVQRSSCVRRERRHGSRSRKPGFSSTACAEPSEMPTAAAMPSERLRASATAREIALRRAASRAWWTESSVTFEGALTRASPEPDAVTPGP